MSLCLIRWGQGSSVGGHCVQDKLHLLPHLKECQGGGSVHGSGQCSRPRWLAGDRTGQISIMTLNHTTGLVFHCKYQNVDDNMPYQCYSSDPLFWSDGGIIFLSSLVSGRVRLHWKCCCSEAGQKPLCVAPSFLRFIGCLPLHSRLNVYNNGNQVKQILLAWS